MKEPLSRIATIQKEGRVDEGFEKLVSDTGFFWVRVLRHHTHFVVDMRDGQVINGSVRKELPVFILM